MKIKNLTIVGGGTSAWLAAAYLVHNQPDIKITVVDKEIGNPIGVGEATLLTFRPFLEEAGIDVDDWFLEIDAGYKSGILFSNWRTDGDQIWHPFTKGNRTIEDRFHVCDLWSNNQDLDFKKYAMAMYDSTVLENTVDYNNLESFAYHVGCGKLVLFLQKKLQRKITFVASDVVNVLYKDDKEIDHLELKNGERIYSDLYIDCTGFKKILIGVGSEIPKSIYDKRIYNNLRKL